MVSSQATWEYLLSSAVPAMMPSVCVWNATAPSQHSMLAVKCVIPVEALAWSLVDGLPLRSRKLWPLSSTSSSPQIVSIYIVKSANFVHGNSVRMQNVAPATSPVLVLNTCVPVPINSFWRRGCHRVCIVQQLPMLTNLVAFTKRNHRSCLLRWCISNALRCSAVIDAVGTPDVLNSDRSRVLSPFPHANPTMD